MKISVAIDGPAGAGKSTIAKLVGKKFDLMYINTGAMYRAVALLAKRNNIDTTNVEKLISMIDGMDMRFENDDLILDNINIQNEITMPEISEIVSDYASIPEVRRKLVFLQRKMSEKYNVIMDGRDIGTVVLKNSRFKFFLTASAEERARRRYKQNLEKGIEQTYEEVLKNIQARDKNDKEKEVGALKIAEDAIVVDTTKMTIEEVKEKVKEIILERRK